MKPPATSLARLCGSHRELITQSFSCVSATIAKILHTEDRTRLVSSAPSIRGSEQLQTGRLTNAIAPNHHGNDGVSREREREPTLTARLRPKSIHAPSPFLRAQHASAIYLGVCTIYEYYPRLCLRRRLPVADAFLVSANSCRRERGDSPSKDQTSTETYSLKR